MLKYTMVQWLAFFYIYCIFGWCFESIYVSVREKHWVNRGFMTGPYIPLYGSGAVLVLFVTIPVRGNYVLMYLIGAAAATVLEYCTGVFMERLFAVRYWDYSDRKFNFQGRICLPATILWGFFSLFMVEFIHLPIERAVFSINEQLLTNGTLIFTVIFIFDFAMSFRTAIDLRDVLIQAEKARKEIQLMQKRVEVIEAVIKDSISDSVDNMKENLKEYVDEGREKVDNRLEKLSEQREYISALTEEKMTELSSHMESLRTRFDNANIAENFRSAVERLESAERIENLQAEMKQMYVRLQNIRSGFSSRIRSREIRMLRRNPSARSAMYKDAMEYLQDRIRKDKTNGD